MPSGRGTSTLPSTAPSLGLLGPVAHPGSSRLPFPLVSIESYELLGVLLAASHCLCVLCLCPWGMSSCSVVAGGQVRGPTF